MEPNNTANLENKADKGSWFKVWHPRGVQVSHNISGDAKSLLALVSEYLDAGWLISAPGSVPGEDKLEICSVVKRQKRNPDGSLSPIIDFYETGNDFKTVSHYLDTRDEVLDFEFASGLRIDNIPLFESDTAPKRGGNADNKIINAPRTFIIYIKANPKWKQIDADAAKAANKGYKIATRILARYEKQRPTEDGNGNQQPTQANGTQAKPAQAAQSAPTVDGKAVDFWASNWNAWLDWLDQVDAGKIPEQASLTARNFSEKIKADFSSMPKEIQKPVWNSVGNRVKRYAEEKRKWWWAAAMKEWTDPNEVPF